MDQIGILIIDNDEANQLALRQVLDSEGWHVRVVSALDRALAELSSGEWSLVIANIGMMGLSSPVFTTLKELALAPAVEGDNVRARVLFIVRESESRKFVPALERDRLPYALKPFQFHDLLEKVSDLLLEAAALENPIRRVRHDATASERKLKESREGRESRHEFRRETNMFASRGEYVMTEEEIAEYEKSEREAEEVKKKRKLHGNTF